MASRRGHFSSSKTFVDLLTSTDRTGAYEFAQAILGIDTSHTAAVAPDAKDVDLPFQHWLADVVGLTEVRWDPSKHPRRGTSPNPGWFAVVSGSDEFSKIIKGIKLPRQKQDEKPEGSTGMKATSSLSFPSPARSLRQVRSSFPSVRAMISASPSN